MSKVTPITSRKTDHIRINLEEDVSSGLTNGLERYHFLHQALPEIDFEQIDLCTNLFGKTLKAPILISSMTGGTEEAGIINQSLATAAQNTGIAMGLGSQRIALQEPKLAYSFQVRNAAPDILLFANLGAIQLNYGYDVDHCIKAVEMVEADALILHLNPLQEAVQPSGETNFSGLLKKIEKVCTLLTVPVVVKEVGWGISEETAVMLADAGVAAIDVAGAGGTSWTQVEMHRAENSRQAHLASIFKDWGIPTSESILQVHKARSNLPIIASGGIRSGLDIAKCIALGATLGGIAGLFLQAAAHSVENTIQAIEDIRREIQVTMFATGASSLEKLPGRLLRKNPPE